MHSWEVVAIGMREDAESDPADCRAIREIGYLAPTLRVKDVDTAGKMIVQGHSQWHVTVDGEALALVAVEEESDHYCRTLDEDSPDDPLLALPTISAWEKGERMERIR